MNVHGSSLEVDVGVGSSANRLLSTADFLVGVVWVSLSKREDFGRLDGEGEAKGLFGEGSSSPKRDILGG